MQRHEFASLVMHVMQFPSCFWPFISTTKTVTRNQKLSNCFGYLWYQTCCSRKMYQLKLSIPVSQTIEHDIYNAMGTIPSQCMQCNFSSDSRAKLSCDFRRPQYVILDTLFCFLALFVYNKNCKQKPEAIKKKTFGIIDVKSAMIGKIIN